MQILVLDNSQHRITFFQNGLKGHKLTICRHAAAAIKALKSASYDIIFLDHDLDKAPANPEDVNSGSEVARFIARNNIACDLLVVHSENRVGRASMETVLGNCKSIPYSRLKKVGFHALLKSISARNSNESGY